MAHEQVRAAEGGCARGKKKERRCASARGGEGHGCAREEERRGGEKKKERGGKKKLIEIAQEEGEKKGKKRERRKEKKRAQLAPASVSVFDIYIWSGAYLLHSFLLGGGVCFTLVYIPFDLPQQVSHMGFCFKSSFVLGSHSSLSLLFTFRFLSILNICHTS